MRIPVGASVLGLPAEATALLVMPPSFQNTLKRTAAA